MANLEDSHMEITCVECGATFPAASKHLTLVCSEACRKLRNKNALREHRRRARTKIDIACAHCATLFVTTDARKQFCTKQCASIACSTNWQKRNPERVKATATSEHGRELQRNAFRKRYKLFPARHLNYYHSQRIANRQPLDGEDFLVKAVKGCLDCGRTDVKMTVAHLIPLSVGGTNDRDNIDAQCRSCNTRQGNKIHVAVYDVWYPFA